MNRLFVLLFFILFTVKTFTQNSESIQKVDSIYNLQTSPEERISLLEYLLKTANENFSKDAASYAYHRLGILYSLEKNYTKAIEKTRQSIEIRKKTGAVDYYKISNSLYNINYYYNALGEETEQKKAIREIQNLPTKNKYTYKSLIDLGYLFENVGDYFYALQNFNSVIEKYGIDYDDNVTLLKAHEGAIWAYSKIDEPKRYFKEIAYHICEIDELLNANENLYTNEGYKNNLANIYEGLEDYERAVKLYLESKNITEQQQDSAKLGKIYNNLGRIYNKLKQPKIAETYFDSALKMSTNPSAVAAVYNNKGDYLSSTIKLKNNKKAIAILLGKNYESLPDFESVKQSKYKLDILDYLIENVEEETLLYEVEQKESNLDKAIQTCVLADELVSNIRQESIVDTSKLFWIRKAATFYMKAVALSYYKNDLAKAFYFMEKNKGLLLLENLHKEDQQLLKEPKIIGFNESLKKYVDDHSSLIEYILNEKEGYGIFCSNKEKVFFKLQNVPQLNREIDILKNKMANYFVYADDRLKYNELANKVYKKLFPFSESVEKIRGKKLTIIPDYKLQYINFEALIPQLHPSEYLVENTEVAYLLSASVSQKLNTSKGAEKNTVLGIAPVEFKEKTLPILTRSKEAMEQIASVYPTDLFIEEKALKDTFLREVNQHTIVHINSHAGIDEIENKPWIAFRKEKLSLEELMQIPNNAELVVLDACNGAIGEQEIGEGIMSLSRGFFSGGAKSVITTQWKANEKAVNEILSIFYKELKKGKSKSKALQNAKKEYLKTHQLSEVSPYYWASLILTGNSDAIQTNSDIKYKWIVIVCVLIVVFLIVLKRKKK